MNSIIIYFFSMPIPLVYKMVALDLHIISVVFYFIYFLCIESKCYVFWEHIFTTYPLKRVVISAVKVIIKS